MGSCYDKHHSGEMFAFGERNPQRTRISSGLTLLYYQSKYDGTLAARRAAAAVRGSVLPSTAQCGHCATE